MTAAHSVEIVDRDGWRREFPLAKPLIHIGSDARNDIVLDASRGAGVAPRHLQLIALPGQSSGYRVINLGETAVLLGEAGDMPLEPRSAVEIADGEHCQLGDYRLVFHLGELAQRGLPGDAAPVGAAAVPSTQTPVTGQPVARAPVAATGQQASAFIGLKLALPQSEVSPESPLEGIVAVRNLGNEPGVQFRLELEGLEPEHYELGQGPILFPNVEKGVFLRIHHPRGPEILSGRREIAIRAMAPEAYPGESVAVKQVLEILPYYSHELRLVSAD